MSVLLDSNALIALCVQGHQFHPAMTAWIASAPLPFATCDITQGALLRFLLQQKIALDAGQAWQFLNIVQSGPNHEFWPEAINYLSVPTRGIIGHRQVTDAYLAQLARSRCAKIATFDGGLFALHSDCALLIPTKIHSP